ncbi:MAG: hypothetical protein AVDCRST_MAG25-2798, partial [uncultured Rubrobacteraceae bacterium]
EVHIRSGAVVPSRCCGRAGYLGGDGAPLGEVGQAQGLPAR